MEIITLQKLQENFNEIFNKSIDKQDIIDEQISAIKEYVKYVPNFRAFKKPVEKNSKEDINKVLNFKISDLSKSLFKEAFNTFKTTGEYKLERLYSDTNETYQIKEDTVKQAYILSEYYMWLKNYNINSKKEEDFNIGLKLLSLEYLGVALLKNDKTKIARTLSPILGMHPQTIRTSLTYLHIENNEIRTSENLLKLQEFFKKQGFTDIVSKIQKDIEAL